MRRREDQMRGGRKEGEVLVQDGGQMRDRRGLGVADRGRGLFEGGRGGRNSSRAEEDGSNDGDRTERSIVPSEGNILRSPNIIYSSAPLLITEREENVMGVPSNDKLEI